MGAAAPSFACATLGVGTGPFALVWIAFSPIDIAAARGFCVRSDDIVSASYAIAGSPVNNDGTSFERPFATRAKKKPVSAVGCIDLGCRWPVATKGWPRATWVHYRVRNGFDTHLCTLCMCAKRNLWAEELRETGAVALEQLWGEWV